MYGVRPYVKKKGFNLNRVGHQRRPTQPKRKILGKRSGTERIKNRLEIQMINSLNMKFINQSLHNLQQNRLGGNSFPLTEYVFC